MVQIADLADLERKAAVYNLGQLPNRIDYIRQSGGNVVPRVTLFFPSSDIDGFGQRHSALYYNNLESLGVPHLQKDGPGESSDDGFKMFGRHESSSDTHAGDVGVRVWGEKSVRALVEAGVLYFPGAEQFGCKQPKAERVARQ